MADNRAGYFCLLGAPLGEEELARAEFQALVGIPANDARLPSAPAAADVSRAAYISLCAEHIASGSDLGELCRQVGERGLAADGFAIREKRIPHGLEVNLRESVISVAGCITGHPDLRTPSVEFLLVARPEGWDFGRIISQADRSWAKHVRKLHSYSSSISSRMARAMVNIAGQPGQRLLDPCCGAGTILIEAASLGLEAVGCDINPLWPPRALENAQNFGLSVGAFVADATEVSGCFDMVVTDLPYGRNVLLDLRETREILANVGKLAPILVLVAGQRLEEMLNDLGYQSRLVATAKKGSLVRYFYHCLAPHPRNANARRFRPSKGRPLG